MKVLFKQYVFIHVPMPQPLIPVFKHSLLYSLRSFKELSIFLPAVAKATVEKSD